MNGEEAEPHGLSLQIPSPATFLSASSNSAGTGQFLAGFSSVSTVSAASGASGQPSSSGGNETHASNNSSELVEFKNTPAPLLFVVPPSPAPEDSSSSSSSYTIASSSTSASSQAFNTQENHSFYQEEDFCPAETEEKRGVLELDPEDWKSVSDSEVASTDFASSYTASSYVTATTSEHTHQVEESEIQNFSNPLDSVFARLKKEIPATCNFVTKVPCVPLAAPFFVVQIIQVICLATQPWFFTSSDVQFCV